MEVARRAPVGRLYYGWIILGAISVTEVVSWGILYYAFSVFVAPMQAELGWSQVAITGAYSLALLCAGVAAIPVGRWLDRHGPRALMTLGACLGSLLLVAWSQVSNLWSFYLIMAGLGLAMASVLYEPAFALIATWFHRQRTKALTILTFCGAWASVIFIPLSAWLVEHAGWRPALLALASILAGMTILPHALVLRRRPQDLGLLPDGRPAVAADARTPALPERSIAPRVALREISFWLLTLAFATSTLAGVTMTVYFIPYLVTRGQSPSAAATVAGLFGLMSLLGRVVLGPLGAHYPRHRLGAALLGMQLAGLLVLIALPSFAGAVVAVLLFGAGSGTLTIVRATLLAERYGPAHYGSINGTMSLILTGARALAPVGAGAIVLLSGSYALLLWLLIGLLLLGGLALLR